MVSRPEGLIPAAPDLAREMAARLSRDHIREVWDVGGVGAESALAMSLAVSVEAYAFVPRAGGGPVFMMGVEEKCVLTGSAVVWMLGSESVSRRPGRVFRAALWGMRRAFGVTGAHCLEQFIPDWYRTGLNFAERLGFALAPSAFAGVNGAALWCAVADRRDFIEKWEKKWERRKHSPPSPARA